MDIPKEPMKNIGVRFPITLFQRIQALAKQENRSFNGQVIHMLQDYLARLAQKDK
jgi:hypothetical protein